MKNLIKVEKSQQKQHHLIRKIWLSKVKRETDSNNQKMRKSKKTLMKILTTKEKKQRVKKKQCKIRTKT